MPDPAIRPLRETDETEWLRLRRALWPEDDANDLQREMATIRADPDRQPVFVAERPDGGLCGLLEVSIRRSAPGCKTDRIGYLEGWYVDPDWRRRGVGRRLVDAAEAWARTAGCREMASDTEPGYPLSPQAHAALGYQEVERYFRKDLA
jgi:aminoglycoside 6'-N-acetyltransferase I